MLKLRIFFFVIVPIISLYAGLCQGTQIIPSTLEYMADFSDTIVIGHVIDKHSYWEDKKIYTNIAIDVKQFVKNPRGETSPSIQLKIPGGKVGAINFEIDKAPVCEIGEKEMLFLMN